MAALISIGSQGGSEREESSSKLDMVEKEVSLMSVPFIQSVKRRMESVGGSLVGSGDASRFEIVENDALRVRIYRAVDDSVAGMTMTGTTEAYILNVGDYTTVRTAYDDDYKWETLDDFFECVDAYVRGDYHEEVGERNGRVVSRQLNLNVPGGTRTISGSVGVGSRIRRLLGYEKSIVRPTSPGH